MTRKQVAMRLGTSIATVRRLEGVLLHPFRDARGVHRFDPEEVEELVEDVECGEVRLAHELRPAAAGLGHGGGKCARCGSLRRELLPARNELEQHRLRHASALRVLREEHATENARLESNVGTLVAELNDLVDVLNR